MKTSPTRRLRRAALFAVLTASVAATVLAVGAGGAVASAASGGANPIARTDDGLVRGADVAGVNSFLGLPYAAPPTGNLRWRPPAGGGLVRSAGRDAVRAELPAADDEQSLPSARADQ